MHFRLFHIVVVLMLGLAAKAQPDIRITADKRMIRTGEPDTLTLTATWPGHPLKQGFTVADTFPHFEVWERGQPVPTTDGIRQTIVVTGYDSGQFSLPPLPLADEPAYASDSFPILIQPVNVDTLADYHDIKDIVEVPAVINWPLVLLIGILVIGAITGLYFFIKKRQGKQTGSKQARAGAYQQALEALDRLAPQAEKSGPAKPFFVALTGIYRNYVADAYRYRSQQQTGGELLIQARPLLPEAAFTQLAAAIRTGDAVKFAKYEPVRPEWQTALSAIRQAIDILERQLVEKRRKEELAAGREKAGNYPRKR